MSAEGVYLPRCFSLTAVVQVNAIGLAISPLVFFLLFRQKRTFKVFIQEVHPIDSVDALKDK